VHIRIGENGERQGLPIVPPFQHDSSTSFEGQLTVTPRTMPSQCRRDRSCC
jgi:hypothetical protein